MAITMKAARLNAGYTQEQAAKKLGVNKCTLVNWESGKTAPTIWQWEDLCDLYEMGFGDILVPKKFNKIEHGVAG